MEGAETADLVLMIREWAEVLRRNYHELVGLFCQSGKDYRPVGQIVRTQLRYFQASYLMNSLNRSSRFFLLTSLAAFCSTGVFAAEAVRTAHGTLEGSKNQSSGVRMFKGIPYAAPPVGDLRWKEPQPAKDWTGVRQATQFGPRCMQLPLFGDMNFRSNGMGEDCLYLNVWSPVASGTGGLPVLVYFYGGGYVAGDGSEPRYDGESMAAKGIVALTVNYRLGVFGFMAHPELTRESPHHASGDYGLLDQAAAIQWVKENIAAFGGDPKKITIAGESAGSTSVSALMASPLSRDLIAGAIGESGSLLGTLSPVSLPEAEKVGEKFGLSANATSLSALRALSADQLLQRTSRSGGRGFPVTIDGYFLPQTPWLIYSTGKQGHVPLLVGWNSAEMTGLSLLGKLPPTLENYAAAVHKLYGEHAEDILKLYPAATNEQVMDISTALASDRFIGFSTWAWSNLAEKTGGRPVYRYRFARARPAMRPEMGDAAPGLAGGVIHNAKAKGIPPPPASGAVHSAEIEYAMGNLSTNHVYAWSQDDYKVSKLMEAYFANFIKTGDPNATGLPEWPAANSGDAVRVMNIDVESGAKPEAHRERYLFLEQLADKK